MKRSKLFIGLFLVFILGVLAGGLGVGLYVKHQRTTFLESRHGRHTDFILQKLTRKLELSSEQHKEIKAILSDAEKSMLAFREKNRPEIEAIFKEHEQRIRSILSEEQREKFDQCQNRMMNMRPPGMGKPFFGGKPRHRPEKWADGEPKPPRPFDQEAP